MKKLMLVLFSLIIVVWLVPQATFAKTIRLRFAHVAPPFHGQHKGALHFKKFVEMNSGGRIEVSVHPAGQLGGEVALVQAIQTGILEMGSIGDPAFSNMIPQMSLFALPFFYPGKEAVDRVWSGPVGQKVASYFPPKNLRLLAWSGNGFRDFGNNKKPIHNPSDIAKLKIRTQESSLYIDSYKAIGVRPIPLPWPEVFSSLQQGVVDGLDLPYNGMWMAKTYEALKYVTLSEWVYSGILFTVNKKFFDSLPNDLQRCVREAAHEGARVSLGINYQDDLKALEGLKSKGLIVNSLTPEEKAVFKEQLKPVYDKWKKRIGEDLFNEALMAAQGK